LSARESDGRPPRASSVRAVVGGVHFGLAAARLAESLLLGLAGALVTLAAGVASGLAPGALAGVATLAGLCAGTAFWLERPLELARTARELDARLRHHGALSTAFELEGRGRALAPLEELVRARVLARLRLDEAVRALFPPLFVPVAAPVAAGLLLYFVSSGVDRPVPASVDFAALANGLEQALSMPSLSEESTGLAGEDEEGGLSRAQVQEVSTALHARAALPFVAEDWRRAPEELWNRVDELDRSLADLAARTERGSELGERLAAARPWLDALRQALAAEGGGEGSASGAGTGGSTQGTIGSSTPASGVSTPAPRPTNPPPDSARELGTQAGAWWPAEYDGLVARWVELSRAERAPDEQR
jgi:hypothetical protein